MNRLVQIPKIKTTVHFLVLFFLNWILQYMRNLQGVQNFVCPRCTNRGGEVGEDYVDDKGSGLVVNGDMLEEVE